MKTKLKTKFKAKQGGDPWADAPDEITAFVRSELENGGTLTKEEAHAEVQAYADRNGWELTDDFWGQLETCFDAADTNGDGELDGAEVAAAWKNMAGDQMPEDITYPTEQEMRDWVDSELAKDGDITKEEAYTYIANWAASNGF